VYIAPHILSFSASAWPANTHIIVPANFISFLLLRMAGPSGRAV
jgi:hypothetical protein